MIEIILAALFLFFFIAYAAEALPKSGLLLMILVLIVAKLIRGGD